jgi:hypothetical protein
MVNDLLICVTLLVGPVLFVVGALGVFGRFETLFASPVQSDYAHDVLFVGAPTPTGRRL